ncbi:MAG: Holliday junction resolvase RuvX [Melioribacteraceae bacterium]|nr:Holliday junction resolvase RuvX [Melioribacteraceae bacterium]
MIEERILAIDFGEKRIGIAITDPLKIFAYPLTTLNNDSKLMDALKEIINKYSVTKIILGIPLREDGSETVISRKVMNFKLDVEMEFNIDIELVDERYSSSIAKDRIIESVVSKKKRRDKSLLDKNAAAVILEDWLRSH